MTEAGLRRFSGCRILVVGDIMLDRYIRGSASRLSPEAPVPVLLSTSRHDTLGGAANVARNIVAFGAKCDLAGLIGNDEAGEAVIALCEEAGIGIAGVVIREDGPTTLKTRVLSGNQHLLRIDSEKVTPAESSVYDRLFESLSETLATNPPHALIVSDYAKGVTEVGFIRRLLEFATQRQVPVFVDPKGTDFQKYRGASVIKPNRVEMHEFAKRWGWSIEDPIAAAQQLRIEAGLSHVALTLGDQGMALVSDGMVRRIPTRAREVFDVTGAGDTVMASFAVAIASGFDPAEACDIANHAAAIVVGRVGSASVSIDELIAAIDSWN